MPLRILKNTYVDLSVYDGVYPLANNDSLAGLQAAMNYCRANNLVGYMPAGTSYLLSGTLMGMAAHTTAGKTNQTMVNSFRLVGAASGGARPIITMADGFAPSAGTKKAMFRIGQYDPPNPSASPPVLANTNDNAESAYGAVLKNLDLRAGSNNAGLIVLNSFLAQHCFFENIKITGTGAYACIASGVGPGSAIVGMELIGGAYGILNDIGVDGVQAGAGWYYRHIKLNGQTVYAIWHRGNRGGGFSGVQILNAPPVAIMQGDFSNAARGNIVLKDVSCAWPGAAGTFIQNNSTVDKTTVLSNCYLSNCSTVLNATGDAVTGGDVTNNATANPLIVANGVYTPGGSYTNGHSGSGPTGITCKRQVNGVVTNGPVKGITVTTAGSVPATLFSRWAKWADLDGVSSPNVIDAVAQYGAVPGNASVDSRAAIQAAIDAADAATRAGTPTGVFLQKGVYYCSAAPVVKGDIHFFGAPGRLTQIYANASWANGLAAKDWIVWTDDDIYGASKIYDIVANHSSSSATDNGGIGSNLLGGFHFRQGRNSGSHSLKYGTTPQIGETQPRQVFRFSGPNSTDAYSGNAGGDHITIVDHAQCLAAEKLTISAGYRKLMINGTEEPLRIGQLDLEHGGISDVANAEFFEIVDSVNWEVDFCKFETVGAVGRIKGDSEGRMDFIAAWVPGATTNAIVDLTSPAIILESTGPVEARKMPKFEASFIFAPVRATGSYGAIVSEIGYTYGSNEAVNRQHVISEFVRRPEGSGLFDREAMFVATTRPAEPPAPSDPNAIASTTWYLWFEGLDPSTTDLAIADMEASITVGGDDILSTATITSGSTGANAGNLTDDNGDATNFTATEGVVVTIAFGTAKAIKEFRLKGPASVAPPLACDVWCFDAALGYARKMASTVWSSFAAAETKSIVINRRGRRATITDRASVSFGGAVPGDPEATVPVTSAGLTQYWPLLAPTADLTYSGPSIDWVPAAVAVAVRQVVYMTADGWALASASAEATAAGELGFVVKAAASGGFPVVATEGAMIRSDTQTSARGTSLYLGTTAGTMVTSPPSGDGNVRRYLGQKFNATTFKFQPGVPFTYTTS